jgi:hypothetical protein
LRSTATCGYGTPGLRTHPCDSSATKERHTRREPSVPGGGSLPKRNGSASTLIWNGLITTTKANVEDLRWFLPLPDGADNGWEQTLTSVTPYSILKAETVPTSRPLRSDRTCCEMSHPLDRRAKDLPASRSKALDSGSQDRHIIGVLVATFRDFIQMALCGAVGARTHDRRIMRSLARRTGRAACTDFTESRR